MKKDWAGRTTFRGRSRRRTCWNRASTGRARSEGRSSHRRAANRGAGRGRGDRKLRACCLAGGIAGSFWRAAKALRKAKPKSEGAGVAEGAELPHVASRAEDGGATRPYGRLPEPGAGGPRSRGPETSALLPRGRDCRKFLERCRGAQKARPGPEGAEACGGLRCAAEKKRPRAGRLGALHSEGWRREGTRRQGCCLCDFIIAVSDIIVYNPKAIFSRIAR